MQALHARLRPRHAWRSMLDEPAGLARDGRDMRGYSLLGIRAFVPLICDRASAARRGVQRGWSYPSYQSKSSMAQHADRPPLYCKHFISVSRAQTIKGALHNKPQQQLHSCCTSRCTLLLKVHIGLRLRNGFMVRPTPQACRPRQQPALAALSGKHSRGILDLI